MRVFVTGASGFIGSAVVPELIAAGHRVIGLARSDSSAASVKAMGAEVLRGGLDDLEVLRDGAARSDGVVHLAFIHDFSNFEASVRADVRAIEAMGAALEGSGKPLAVASGTLDVKPGHLATEKDEPPPNVSPRMAGARAALALVPRGVRTVMLRFAPSVHGPGDKGFMAMLIAIARQKGVAGYIDEGTQRWTAVHRLDAARLVRLAIEQAAPGTAVHAVADEGVAIRAVAEIMGKHLGLPAKSIPRAEAPAHFGFLGTFLGLDSPASSAMTRELLGWQPTHAGLLEDLDQGHYFDEKAAPTH
jgi:nucleoside-diphosphate-sugar epimerase